MRPRAIVCAVAVCAAITATSMLLAQTPSSPQAPQPPTPIFRTSTDLVTVDVGVKSGGTPVASLGASDFTLLDNGVPQHVESVEMEQVPVDITILVDTNETIAANVDSLNGDLKKIAAFVRPDDHLRVMRIDTYVTDLVPLRRAGDRPAISTVRPGGLSSVNDGLAAAMIRANPDRPQLIVAITDGVDAISTLSYEAVRDIAKQSSATVHISWLTMTELPTPQRFSSPPYPPIYWESTHERLLPFQCGTTGSCQPTHRAWLPYSIPASPNREIHEFASLREAVALTGGEIHPPGIFAERSAAAVFQRVFEDYRRSYLLRYAPQGVSHDGWHDIVVKIPAHVGYEIHARRGYAIDTGRLPGAASVPPPAAAATLTSLGDLEQAYARGDYEAVLTAARAVPDHAKMLRDFRAAGNPFPAHPHREAVLTLELADAALHDPHDEARVAARNTLEWYGPLVRSPIEPDAFEHDWLSAGLALLEGANAPGAAQGFINHALARFPGEPRFLLAKAIVADQTWAQATPDAGSSESSIPAGSLPFADVIALYEAAMKDSATTFEARVRESWLLHRVGRDADALTMLDRAGDRAPDAAMGYLRELFRGRVLTTLGRTDDATTALARAEAIKPAGEPDPWAMYRQGDYRLYPGAITRLRAQSLGRKAQ